MAYGNRTGKYKLQRVGSVNSFQKLIHTYFGLKLPNVKIAVTGSGRVAHGVLEIMNLMGVHEVEPEDFMEREFTYPVLSTSKAPTYTLTNKRANTTGRIFISTPKIMVAPSVISWQKRIY